MGIDLSLIWAVIIIFGIMMYVVMDGFDLGIGILFPFLADTSERDVAMNTVAPIWDGNEAARWRRPSSRVSHLAPSFMASPWSIELMPVVPWTG